MTTPPALADAPVARRRRLVFSGDISGRAGPRPRFFIDAEAFDPDRVDQLVEAGTVEEWTVVNRDVMQHPFHLHVNPFQVVQLEGVPSGDDSWLPDPAISWDVFRIPPRGPATLRMRFRPDVTGLTVYHGHVLPHEDDGMMGTVLIDPSQSSR